MRRTLFVSLLLHAFLLVGLQTTFTVDWLKKPLKTYKVEFFRPPVEPVEEAERPGTALSDTPAERAKNTEDAIETISLDTKDQRYISYAKVIQARLAANWGQYPREATENLIEGDVLVLFTLNNQGRLLGIQFLEPSPFDILNRETERTIRASAPFPPFTRAMNLDRVNIQATFEYRLLGN